MQRIFCGKFLSISDRKNVVTINFTTFFTIRKEIGHLDFTLGAFLHHKFKTSVIFQYATFLILIIIALMLPSISRKPFELGRN